MTVRTDKTVTRPRARLGARSHRCAASGGLSPSNNSEAMTCKEATDSSFCFLLPEVPACAPAFQASRMQDLDVTFFVRLPPSGHTLQTGMRTRASQL
jgi:hypothetical protein